jgi:serine/threonine kinase 16
VSQALKEVEAYTLFTPNPNIIHSIDHAVLNDSSTKVSGIGDTGGSTKTVYILLPYYRRGNLQDTINANLVNHTRFPERKLMKLMLGVCNALKAMHQYRVRSTNPNASSRAAAKAVRQEAAAEDEDAARRKARAQKRSMTADQQHQQDLNEELEEPLMQDEVTRAQEGKAPGDTRAYAHRDIKPGNIMIDDDGERPILMDLGSLAPSPTPITSRSLALAVQDTAAEHSTMPYRAPELFDVKTGSVIDTKVDIWSLGCTMYACLVGKSPFEARSDETGGSLSICVLGGDWRWPGEGSASKGKQPNGEAAAAKADLYPNPMVRDVVSRCLQVEPNERPDVDELITLLQDCVEQLPRDEGSLSAEP